MSRRVLVTGAGGFVGANLCRRLLRDGVVVHAVVRPGSDPWRLAGLAGEIVLHESALGERRPIAELFDVVRPEWVFHLAAHGAYSWQTDVDTIFSVNAMGSAHLTDLAVEHDVEAFVQAGSSSEYGFKDHAPDEQEWIEPNSTYAVSKAAATHYVRAAAQRHDRHLVTLRLYSIYGPWEDPNRLMPALALHGLRGEFPPLVDPRVARDYVAVDDVSEAFVACARAPAVPRGSVYNLASGTQTTLGDLVALVRNELAIAQEPEWSTMASRGWDTDVWVGCPERIMRDLGWRANTDLREGFSALVAWLQRNPELRRRYERALRSIPG